MTRYLVCCSVPGLWSKTWSDIGDGREGIKRWGVGGILLELGEFNLHAFGL